MPTIAEVLKHIISQEVLYSPHGTERQPIAGHVKRQLNERVKATEAGIKDLFFLTAFLDVATADEAIQSFREQHPNLKETLIEIATKHEKHIKDLISAYQNGKPSKGDAAFLEQNKEQFDNLFECDAFKNLYCSVPGRFRLKGLMVLFTVIAEIYQNGNNNIVTLLNGDENFHRRLTNIKGVGDKLSRWAITNIDGRRFVIDVQIAKTLKRIGVNNKRLEARNAEEVWQNLFGEFRDGNRANFPQQHFNELFVKEYGFETNDYQYLPFIITQAFWFYGRDRCLLLDEKLPRLDP